MKNGIIIFIAVLLVTGFYSCKKYREYDNLDVIEDTFTGELSIASSTWQVNSDFSGTSSSGSYCFIWENPSRAAILVTELTGSGEVRFEFEDARGNIVFNETVTVEEVTSLADVTEKGPKGNWFIKVFFTNFSGEGNFSLDTDQ